MRTINTMIERDIKAYMKFGCSLEVACEKVNSLHLNKHLKAVQEVKKQLTVAV